MSMSKKDFIALGEAVRDAAPVIGENGQKSAEAAEMRARIIDAIADACERSNPAFKRGRWLDFVAGKCGPNGKAPIKEAR